jgi:hypothetical protein
MNITKKLKTKITKPNKTAKPKKKTGEIRMPRGRALMLRTCAAGMLAHGGFVWPTSGEVKAHDWKADKVCGFGLHGLLWGRSANGRRGDALSRSGPEKKFTEVQRVAKSSFSSMRSALGGAPPN